MKVLVVDGSRAVRDRLCEMLHAIDFVEAVSQAESEGEAAEKLENGNLDVLILDAKLKVGNGIRLLEHIRQEEHSPSTIILTNNPYPQYRERCIGMGAEFFLDKSSDFVKIPDILLALNGKSSPGKDVVSNERGR